MTVIQRLCGGWGGGEKGKRMTGWGAMPKCIVSVYETAQSNSLKAAEKWRGVQTGLIR
jgi:hypothetical protein